MLPFAVIGVFHLVTLALGWSAGSTVSKWFLMPALALALLIGAPRRASPLVLLASVGIAFSWLGDVLLGNPGDSAFLTGLGLFFLAHVVYVILFLGPMREKRLPLVALVYVAWWVALVVLLAPHVGSLLIPVAAYGLILAASAATALGTNRITAIGGAVFIASDTVLAFDRFYPGFALWQVDFVIMLLYITGQGLIIYGAIDRARRDAALTPPSGESAPNALA
jgi:uncharacterized membrane protein YhhN